MKVIFENEYFKFYLTGNDLSNVHLDSKSKEEQEIYDSDEVMSHKEKLIKVDNMIEYFYNFWKLIENNNEKKQYILNININLVMINIPMQYYIKFKNVLDSLKKVITSNLKETNIKIENDLAKYFVNLILTLYKPIKPLHLI